MRNSRFTFTCLINKSIFNQHANKVQSVNENRWNAFISRDVEISIVGFLTVFSVINSSMSGGKLNVDFMSSSDYQNMIEGNCERNRNEINFQRNLPSY